MLGLLLAPNVAIEAPIPEEQEVYFSPLPIPTIPATCNCLAYAKSFGIQNIPIDEPVEGGAMILAEGKTGHIAVILQIDETNREFLVIESNYSSCKITMRRISFDYNKIVRFVY